MIVLNRPTQFDVAAAYDAHGSELLGFAMNAVRDRTAAEDCVQETFLRAWRAQNTFDATRGSIRTWLFAIERNVILDHQRKSRRMPALVALPDEADTSATTVSTTTPTDEALEKMRVQDALSTLTPQHRDVVVAVHITGTSYAELSETTGVGISTLRTRAFYGLRALRQHFDHEAREQDRKEREQ